MAVKSNTKKKPTILPLGLTYHFQQKDKIENRPARSITLNLKRYYLGENFPDKYLTSQEARCMDCFLKGMTDKQTAKITQLAIGTVGFYLSNMRRKLDCQNKKQLIEKIRSSSFNIEKGIDL